MSFFVVDIEADNTTPATGSMHCFGAVKVTEDLNDTFYGELRPITDTWNPEALAVSNFTRKEVLEFDNPEEVMRNFNDWVLVENKSGRPIFFSDNLAFDWMWIAYYFDKYDIKNPFGYSGRRIGDIVTGLENDMFVRWKQWRKTKHTHHPVDDAIGNAEVLLKLKNDYDLNLKLK